MAAPRKGDKALTIMQPWANLIVRGIKRVENRTWPTRHRGRLLIHAGRRVDRTSGMPVGHLFRQAVVGEVMVVDCVRYPAAGEPDPYGLRADPYASGPWCWILLEPRRYEEPVPGPGGLSVWTWPRGQGV